MTPSEWSGAIVEPSEGTAPPEVEEWRSVTVPGRPSAFAGADGVLYRTRFSDPRSGVDSRVVIELRGLYAHARIWCNGTEVGTHNSYFTPGRFELPIEEENELLIECRRPHDRFGGLYDSNRVPEEMKTPGIWWDTTINTYPATFVDDFNISPRMTDDGAVIDVTLVVDAGEATDERATFSVRPIGFRGGGMMERARVRTDDRERTVVTRSIELGEPVQWWPAELGSQRRYSVRVKFNETERSATTGFSHVGYTPREGIQVNGQPLRFRGFNVLPDANHADNIERAMGANANVVRFHGHIPPEQVYELCDEVGMLVWQDFPIVGPGGYDIERAKQIGATVVATHGSHPSLASFTVHTDPRNPFEDHLRGSSLSRMRLRWRIWRTNYDHSPDERVASSLPSEYASFPIAGPPGIEPDASHLYPGWKYGQASDIEWLIDNYEGIETVVGGFGTGTGVRPSSNSGDNNDFDDAMRSQARILKTVAESLRRHRSHAVIVDALNDLGGDGMGVLERDGAEKYGYEAIKRSFEPVQAVLARYPDHSENTVPILVLNDTIDSITGTVTATSGEFTSTNEVTVGRFQQSEGGTIEISPEAGSVNLELNYNDHTVTNTYPTGPS